jgi:anti-anti-sigma regulatory factor
LKIKLESLKNIPVLSVTEEVTKRDVDVLRAGLIKILKTGKNKIILELPSNESLPSEVIRELASFDIMARELAGRLVLAGITPGLKTKIEVFAMPPVILTFENREKAVEFLSTPPAPEAPPSSVVAPAGASTAAANNDELAAFLRSEQSAFKTRIQELEQENKFLKEQIVQVTIARRPPSDESGYREKIVDLEAKIEKLLTEITLETPPSASGAAPITPPV